MHLDHVALATRDVAAPLGVLVGRLGGTLVAGGAWIGFRSLQVFLGDDSGGMKVELLEPWDVDRNDFLARFLARHGDGAHHLTFKVGDLEAALDRVADAGFTPVAVDLSQPEWREAFLLPGDAHGTVVQLADSSTASGMPLDEYRAARRQGPTGEPTWWADPGSPASTPTFLRRVVVRTRDLDAACRLYIDVLDGTPVARDPDHVELEWPGGGRLLLEVALDADAGIDRLELDGALDDVAVAGARLLVRPPGG